MNKLLINFDRYNQDQADVGERIGNLCLGLLRIGFGKTVTVKKIGEHTDFTSVVYSNTSRVAAIGIFILLCPLTIPLTALGFIAVKYSESSKSIFNSYVDFLDPKEVSKNSIELKELNPKSDEPKPNPKNEELELPKETSPILDPANLSGESIEKPQKQHEPDQVPDHSKKNELINTTKDEVLPTISTELPKENRPHPQIRKIPPVSITDTAFQKIGKSLHNDGSQLFSDDEITEKLEIINEYKIDPLDVHNTLVSYTKHNKSIIQQGASRGCSAGAAAMLIMDNGKKPSISEITTRNLGNNESMLREIKNAGLKGIQTSVKNLSELRKAIIQNGSCIVHVNVKLGSHFVVVDEVSEDLSQVRLRDPYHGWEITVTAKAFLKEWVAGKEDWNRLQSNENKGDNTLHLPATTDSNSKLTKEMLKKLKEVPQKNSETDIIQIISE